jgi:1-deoxy-D-xylulose-5-phosphate synthase
VFAVDRAGLVGEDGPTHHGAFDLSFLRIIPGLTVFVPKHEAELQRMLATALTLDGPSVIRYPRSAGTGMKLERPIRPLEAPWVDVVREGSDVLLLTAGPATLWADVAADLLAQKGIRATVAGVRRVHPLDTEAVKALVSAHPCVITVEDNVLAGGFGSAMLEFMSAEGLCRPIERIGLPDAFVCHGSLELLRRDVGLTPEAIAQTAEGLVARIRTHPRAFSS